MTLSFLARIISDAQDAQQEMEMYRSERDRSLKLNHRFEEIVKEQDQKLAEQRKREERQQGEARQILTRHYGYGPEQLNGHDPVQTLYGLQPRAAACYRRNSRKPGEGSTALEEEVNRLGEEVRQLSEQVQGLQGEQARTIDYLHTAAGRDGQGEYYVRSAHLEGAVREFTAAYQQSKQPSLPSLTPASEEKPQQSQLETPPPPSQTPALPPKKRPPLWGAQHGLKRE